MRNKKIIPYDDDSNCLIGVNDLQKLKQLAKNPNIKTVMFNTDIRKYKPNFKTDTIYLVLNKTFLNNKGSGKRYNCKGKKVLFPVDRCAVKGFIGRFILNDVQCDIFPYNTNYDIMKKHLKYASFYPKKLNLLSNLNKTQRDTLEGIEVSILNNTEIEKFLQLFYGKDYLIPRNDISLKQRIVNKINSFFIALNI